MRHVLHAVILIFLFADILVAQTVGLELQKVKKEYESSTEEWRNKYGDAKTDQQSIARYREWPGWSFAPRFIAIAENAESSHEGLEAILAVLDMGRAVSHFDHKLFDHYTRAVDLLLSEHRDKELRTLCSKLRVSNQSEQLLRTLAADGKSRELRAEAYFCLGKLLSKKHEMSQPNSWARQPRVGAFDKYWDSRNRINLERFIENQDTDQLRSDAIRCFDVVISDYSDLLTVQGGEKLNELARREIYELQHLAIGVSAPEIVGVDIDGKPMRLSDHRGKVVLLVFWASWCSPCMGDIPHEKEIHAKFAGRPFAIVGVNADDNLESAQKSVKEKAIPWRSFWNEGDRADGSITSDWNVRVWPTTYVLDQEGIIRFKHLRREKLDAPLEQFIKEAESNMSKNK